MPGGTDQTGLGDLVGIAHGHPTDSCAATCPIRAWAEWREALRAELTHLGEALHPDAPAFRPTTRHGAIGIPGRLDPHARLTGQSVALIVKDAVALLADPERYPPARYAGHSLRAGFATQAAAGGVPLDRIMRQTRHTSVAVALRYIRPGQIWQDNPSAALAYKRTRELMRRQCSSAKATLYEARGRFRVQGAKMSPRLATLGDASSSPRRPCAIRPAEHPFLPGRRRV